VIMYNTYEIRWW